MKPSERVSQNSVLEERDSGAALFTPVLGTDILRPILLFDAEIGLTRWWGLNRE